MGPGQERVLWKSRLQCKQIIYQPATCYGGACGAGHGTDGKMPLAAFNSHNAGLGFHSEPLCIQHVIRLLQRNSCRVLLGCGRDGMLSHGAPSGHVSGTASNYLVGARFCWVSQAIVSDRPSRVHHKKEMAYLGSSVSRPRGLNILDGKMAQTLRSYNTTAPAPSLSSHLWL